MDNERWNRLSVWHNAWLEANAQVDFHRPRLSDPTLHGSYDDDPQTVEAVIRRIRA